MVSTPALLRRPTILILAGAVSFWGCTAQVETESTTEVTDSGSPPAAEAAAEAQIATGMAPQGAPQGSPQNGAADAGASTPGEYEAMMNQQRSPQQGATLPESDPADAEAYARMMAQQGAPGGQADPADDIAAEAAYEAMIAQQGALGGAGVPGAAGGNPEEMMRRGIAAGVAGENAGEFGEEGGPGNEGGGSQFPPGSIQDVVSRFLQASVDGEWETAAELVGDRPKGLAARIAEGTAGEGELSRLQTAATGAKFSGKRSQGRTMALMFKKQSTGITIEVAKQAEGFRVTNIETRGGIR